MTPDFLMLHFQKRVLLLLLFLLLTACSSSEPQATAAESQPAGAGDSAATSAPRDDAGSDGAGSDGAGSPSDSAPTTVLIEVEVDSLSANHVEPPISYSESPTIGGDHFPFWQNCGFYDVPVLEGAAAHSLEHGAVWVTYNPDVLTDDEIDELRSMAVENPKLLISPYEHPEGLVLSAWGAQLRSPFGPEAPAIQQFIADRVDNPELPEAGVTCQGAAGIPPNDVITLIDGSEIPEAFQ